MKANSFRTILTSRLRGSDVRAGTLSMILCTLLVTACSSDSGIVSEPGADPTIGCTGNCVGNSTRLDVVDVERIIAQSVAEASARGVNATVAVVDRVGNVLGVFRMGDRTSRTVLLATQFSDLDGVVDQTNDETFSVRGGLEGIKLPNPDAGGGGLLSINNLDHLGAISKAVTGAYLSTEGMAFTSRTANQIVQDHFNPGEDFQPGGPLFGVQFSQLGCGDFTPLLNPAQIASGQVQPGPHPSPFGLSADPGGLPLYKNGAMVGGIGVIADGVYGFDKVISDQDSDIDELIALAGSFGFGSPPERKDRVTVEGKVFRFADSDFRDLITNPTAATAFDSINSAVGSMIAVRGFTNGTVKAGTVFGQAASGIRSDGGNDFNAALDAFVFVDSANQNRYRPRAGTDGVVLGGTQALTEAEVRTVLSGALAVANRARAQIRYPLGSPARVTISVVDSRGSILGMVRGRDAPTFGADVSLQKARTAAFFSNADAADFFLSPVLSNRDGSIPSNRLPDAIYVQPGNSPGTPALVPSNLENYVQRLRTFLNRSTALADGAVAFSDRAGGNLSRPFFPDGINGSVEGPLSKPAGQWSVFSTGLQLDLSYNAIINAVLLTSAATNDGVTAVDAAVPYPPAPGGGGGCAGQASLASEALGGTVLPEATDPRLANGLQIFPGSVPIYRGDRLVGAIGVSGDGVDQDDMIAFLGVQIASAQLNSSINNAPPAMRADQLTPQGVRLRYVQCPQSPFVDSDEDNVCDGF